MVQAALARGSSGRVLYFACDAAGLPLADASIDVAFALGTFEAVSDVAPFAREARRVLRSGGTFIFTVWNRERWFRSRLLDGRLHGSVDHSAGDLKLALEANGFRDIDVRTTLFLPRRLFWIAFRCASALRLDEILVSLCNRAARFLRAHEQVNRRGWVLLVSARR
jgi:SAM-dependent methyltransferase